MAAEFVHLHVHSQYSFLTSAVKLSDLPGKAKALGMPGVALTRAGDARHCLGVVLVDWTVPRPDGTVMASGTNVFRLGADGRFLDVVGVWN